MKHLVILILLFTGIAEIMAQENALRFSLSEAKTHAVQNNKMLKNAQKDILIAEEQYKESRGAGLPQISATMDYMTNFNYEFAFDMGGGTEISLEDLAKLDEGDYVIIDMFSSSGSTIVMEDQANASIQLSQLIFSGQYWVGLEMAKLGKKIAEQSLNVTELDVIENVTTGYFLILYTGEMLDFLKENKSNLEETLKMTYDMYKAGLIEQVDADQLKITLSNLENQLKSIERSHEYAKTMFKFFAGIPYDQEIELTDNLPGLIKDLENKNLLTNDFEIRKNLTYQLLETQEEIGMQSVKLEQWAYAPTLAGYYSHKEKLLTTSFDLSPKDAAGLTLNIPILEGGSKKAKVSKARIELDKIRTQKELLEEQLLLQEKQLASDLNNAYENYQTQQENVQIAHRVYENIHNKYKQGMVSSLDLTQANSNLLSAENNYISAINELLQAKLKLDKLNNQF